MPVASSRTSRLACLALLSTLLLPERTVAAEPPPSFMALELCAASHGGTCSVDDLLRRGFAGATIAWSKSRRETEREDSDRWDGVVWQLTITPRRGKPVALRLYRSCRELAFDDGTANLPVAEIESVDGMDYLESGSGRTQVERALEKVSRPRPPGDAAPSGAVPPSELLDLEVCAPLVEKGSCTVRELAGAKDLAAARWRWMPAKKTRKTGGSIVQGWHLVLPPDPTDEAQVAFVLVRGCAWGHPVAELGQIDDFGGRPYVATPPDAALRFVRRVVKDRPWPPAE